MKKDITIQKELEQISHTVADIPEQNPYIKDIPSGYFDQLSSHIMNMILDEEKEELPDSLKSVQCINVYNVEKDYFTHLDENVKRKIQHEGNVIFINKRKTVIKYLAAAVITGLLGFGLLNLYSNFKKDAARKAENELAIKEAKEILIKGTLDKELNILNDEEISGYLCMNGDDVHAALVAASLDEESLPDAEEYIYNDNTLNDFLNELNISNKPSNNN